MLIMKNIHFSFSPPSSSYSPRRYGKMLKLWNNIKMPFNVSRETLFIFFFSDKKMWIKAFSSVVLRGFQVDGEGCCSQQIIPDAKLPRDVCFVCWRQGLLSCLQALGWAC